ncbi:MAG: UvrD-helicase domain-containing protein [Bdellovibrionales bacterium]|nr:UvrD-helicase domain-containing protein [Bdellovibrionales bacterium]
MTSAYLSDLNEAQKRAVLHTEGPLLIFAGAGSGKTRVLTRRIAHLLLERHAASYGIFAVTFTNKAAREMKERVQTLLPAAAPDIWVSTFHSSCSRILRAHADLLGYTSRFAIYDTSDSLSVLKKIFKRLDIDPRAVEPRAILSRIDRAKNDFRFPDSFEGTGSYGGNSSFGAFYDGDNFADLYRAYQKELLQANAMDFGDLLCNVVTLFKLEPKLLARYQTRFSHLLVDEYQDTNHVQYLLIQQLAGAHRNLCVVGDDDQSIYAFRGATIQNILNFREDFPDAETVTLDLNYRSTETILSAANSLIARNRKRQPKQMRPVLDRGEPIIHYGAQDERDEARFIGEEIAALLRQDIAFNEIAVLYRTNAQSRALEEKFGALGIPYKIFGGFRFYDRKEIKDIVCYFRLLLNESDNEAFLRVINTPARGLGTTSVQALIEYAHSRETNLLSALTTALAENAPFLTAAARKKFSTFVQLIQKLRTEADRTQALLAECSPERFVQGQLPKDARESLARLLNNIAEHSGYLDALRKQDTLEAQERIENILELSNVGLDFVESSLADGITPSLQGFLDRAGLASDLDQNTAAASDESGPAAERECVSLMTLHLAKGLEFRVVFLPGLEEGLLPHSRSLQDRADIEEERRLCYVGMTRAKERLYLSHAFHRHTFGGPHWNGGQPSRFLGEIPLELLQSTMSDYEPLYY